MTSLLEAAGFRTVDCVTEPMGIHPIITAVPDGRWSTVDAWVGIICGTIFGPSGIGMTTVLPAGGLSQTVGAPTGARQPSWQPFTGNGSPIW